MCVLLTLQAFDLHAGQNTSGKPGREIGPRRLLEEKTDHMCREIIFLIKLMELHSVDIRQKLHLEILCVAYVMLIII